jgi:hypothetical protein
MVTFRGALQLKPSKQAPCVSMQQNWISCAFVIDFLMIVGTFTLKIVAK